MKLFKFFTGILLITLPVLVHGAIYKMVDENGNVTFTDTKPGNTSSEEVTLKPITPIQITPVYKTNSSQGNSNKAEDYYTGVKIVEPSNDSTVRNTGNFDVRLQVVPRLAYGHRIQLYLDGQKTGKAVRKTNFTLENVNRGTHILQAKIIDRQGTVIESVNSTVHVQRTIYKPNVSINPPS